VFDTKTKKYYNILFLYTKNKKDCLNTLFFIGYPETKIATGGVLYENSQYAWEG
jgi:hypothetical protein